MKTKGMIAAALALMGLAACGPTGGAPIESSGEGIVGGTTVKPTDEVATMTALLYESKQGSICTVSILSDEWMLTAAHCVEGATPQTLSVAFVTDVNVSNNSRNVNRIRQATRKVVSIQVHPRFAQTMNHLEELSTAATKAGRELSSDEVDKVTDWGDLALVRLQGKIPSTHRPVPILPELSKLKKGQVVKLAGYGITSGGQLGGGSGTLRQVDVTVSEPVWGETEVLMDQRNRKGACHGDSGGPAYATVGGKLQLFGVTSRGIRDSSDSCVQFSAYTNVQNYRSWIRQVSGL